ncbi:MULTISPECIES: DUF4344 domain-containing metallopeptidase [unclassified Streptomyces]|uniref:DUF4344 domain-containing metallopeptidase n=1 Tax=Streptomyces TaxID=1883 RepID=UPI0013702CB4|nr:MULTISPECIES: DUF4344 domain-containing metallopeptidase [unclassified Streptomyces]NEA03646.1 hypothetical protein [Streptomyces sp. SID10116]MYY84866.1 hypothetical protein [Streptomyces sp. SID335]MYZ18776.1 hypothetical protein [Streptomyces sp. SID337]NDZ92035.1 hypothetical protein [Streptomyces sp. SID10115]NEB50351.1 hypothetical protein [Streptomyces sp. SID339]
MTFFLRRPSASPRQVPGPVVLVGMLAAVGVSAACTPEAVPAAGPATWGISYEAPQRGSGAEAEFLRERHVLEAVRSSLAEQVRLPDGVTMTARSCKDAEAEYDPETGQISVCYEFVAETRDLLRGEERSDRGEDRSDLDADPDERVEGALRETLYHEAAHALIDKWELPFVGREEDVADQFAAHQLIRQGARGQRHLAAVADTYGLYAADDDPEDIDFSDEHSPDAARAANYRCWLYGARPGGHERLVDDTILTRGRSEGCEEEWEALRRGWEHLLKPYREGRDGTS